MFRNMDDLQSILSLNASPALLLRVIVIVMALLLKFGKSIELQEEFMIVY